MKKDAQMWSTIQMKERNNGTVYSEPCKKYDKVTQHHRRYQSNETKTLDLGSLLEKERDVEKMIKNDDGNDSDSVRVIHEPISSTYTRHKGRVLTPTKVRHQFNQDINEHSLQSDILNEYYSSYDSSYHMKQSDTATSLDMGSSLVRVSQVLGPDPPPPSKYHLSIPDEPPKSTHRSPRHYSIRRSSKRNDNSSRRVLGSSSKNPVNVRGKVIAFNTSSSTHDYAMNKNAKAIMNRMKE